MVLLFLATPAIQVSAWSSNSNAELQVGNIVDSYHPYYSSEAYFSTPITVWESADQCACFSQVLNIYDGNALSSVVAQAAFILENDGVFHEVVEYFGDAQGTYPPCLFHYCYDNTLSSTLTQQILNGGYTLKEAFNYNGESTITGAYFVVFDPNNNIVSVNTASFTLTDGYNYLFGETTIMGACSGCHTSFTQTSGTLIYQSQTGDGFVRPRSPVILPQETSNMDYSNTINGLGTAYVTQAFCSSDLSC